jgi:hypothetical protein
MMNCVMAADLYAVKSALNVNIPNHAQSRA